MPEVQHSNQLVGGLMMFGSLITGAFAGVVYAGVIDVGDARGIALAVLGLIGFGEFAMGVWWFFLKGQSS